MNDASIPKSVLLVGGDEPVREVLTDLASSHKLQVEQALDGPECLARTESNAYDLILTDSETSGSDDIELLARIHQIQPGMKVIVMASLSAPEVILSAIRQHAFSYFGNPWTPLPSGI